MFRSSPSSSQTGFTTPSSLSTNPPPTGFKQSLKGALTRAHSIKRALSLKSRSNRPHQTQPEKTSKFSPLTRKNTTGKEKLQISAPTLYEDGKTLATLQRMGVVRAPARQTGFVSAAVAFAEEREERARAEMLEAEKNKKRQRRRGLVVVDHDLGLRSQSSQSTTATASSSVSPLTRSREAPGDPVDRIRWSFFPTHQESNGSAVVDGAKRKELEDIQEVLEAYQGLGIRGVQKEEDGASVSPRTSREDLFRPVIVLGPVRKRRRAGDENVISTVQDPASSMVFEEGNEAEDEKEEEGEGSETAEEKSTDPPSTPLSSPPSSSGSQTKPLRDITTEEDLLRALLHFAPARNLFQTSIIPESGCQTTAVDLWLATKTYKAALDYANSTAKEINIHLHRLGIPYSSTDENDVSGVEKRILQRMLQVDLPDYLQETRNRFEKSADVVAALTTLNTSEPEHSSGYKGRDLLRDGNIPDRAEGLFETFAISEYNCSSNNASFVMASKGFDTTTSVPSSNTFASVASTTPTAGLIADRKTSTALSNLHISFPLVDSKTGKVLYTLHAWVDVTSFVMEDVVNRVLFIEETSRTAAAETLDRELRDSARNLKRPVLGRQCWTKDRGLERLKVLDNALKPLPLPPGPRSALENISNEGEDGDLISIASGESRVEGTPGTSVSGDWTSAAAAAASEKSNLAQVIERLRAVYSQYVIIAPQDINASSSTYIISFVSPSVKPFRRDLQGTDFFEWFDLQCRRRRLRMLFDKERGFYFANDRGIGTGFGGSGGLHFVPLFTTEEEPPFAWVCIFEDFTPVQHTQRRQRSRMMDKENYPPDVWQEIIDTTEPEPQGTGGSWSRNRGRRRRRGGDTI